MATHSSIRAWEIPWTKEPGGLQSMGAQIVGHDWATNRKKMEEQWEMWEEEPDRLVPEELS